jgi:hypothetical protein
LKRIRLLGKVLKESLNAEGIKRFIRYKLTNDDKRFIVETALEVLKNCPPLAFNCAAMSSIWSAIIKDNSSIPVSVIAGNLSWMNKKIFSCNRNIPFSNNPITINEVWDGHCWLELGGFIADISLGRTVKYGNVPNDFRNNLKELFGVNFGLICAEPDTLGLKGLNYTPSYSLTDQQINGLINGFQHDLNTVSPPPL